MSEPKKRKNTIPIIWAIFGFLAALFAAVMCYFIVMLGFTGELWEETLVKTGASRWIAYSALANLVIQTYLAISMAKKIVEIATES
jgi:hypothetical protein